MKKHINCWRAKQQLARSRNRARSLRYRLKSNSWLRKIGIPVNGFLQRDDCFGIPPGQVVGCARGRFSKRGDVMELRYLNDHDDSTLQKKRGETWKSVYAFSL